MAKKYTGSLTLEWFNKNRSIITQKAEEKRESDIPAPRINWINKDEALFYEISEEEGKGLSPYWVNRNDIRVKESRPLVFQKAYKAVPEGDVFKVEESDVDDPEIENILIKGDNLLALNTLIKMFDQKPEDEKVKCIFIDPPYNTGSAFEQYDDSLMHSEWLSLFRDRLVLLHKLLSNNGSIWITLDDNEFHYAKVICDDIFGRDNFLGSIVWNHSVQAKGYSGKLSVSHNYILVYQKTEMFILKDLQRTEENNKNYSNPDNDPKGDWRSGDVRNALWRPNLMYDITTPSGKIIKHPPNGWRFSKETFEKELYEGKIKFSDDENRIIRKIYLSDQEGRVPETLWGAKEVGTTRSANSHLKELFGTKVFDTPKPEELLQRILSLATERDDLVLDIFGGAGSTFSASHKMGRRWIGSEIGSQAEDIIIDRLKKTLSGVDQGGISSMHCWKGGGSFKYYHLGESIICVDKDGYGDFNWTLNRDFIENSLLASYDFILDETFVCPPSTIENPPKVGFYTVNNYTMAGVVSLSSPEEKFGALDNEYISELIAYIRKQKSPQSITIFTNRGVELAWESKPEDVEIIKIPHAIFAELER